MLPRVITLGCVAAWAVGLSAADQTQTQPAPEEVQAARRAVARAVAAVAADLGSDSYRKREAAQKALLDLSEAVLAEVLRQAHVDQPEEAQRVGQLFSSLAVSARQGEMLIAMPAKRRKALLELAKAHPAEFNKLWSQDPATAAAAVTALAVKGGPACESVVCWALRRPHWEVRMAAIQAVGAMDGPSKDINNALWERLEAVGARGEGAGFFDEGSGARWAQEMLRGHESKAAMRSLVALKDDRILARLLRTVFVTRGDSPFGPGREGLVGLIVELNDKRTVATLADRVHENDRVSEIHYGNGKQVSVSTGDLALGIILTQTNQKLADYGFYTGRDRGPSGNEMGFETEAKRTAARAKFRQWWQQHRKEYEGVEKIPLTAESQPAGGGREQLPEFIEMWD